MLVELKRLYNIVGESFEVDFLVDEKSLSDVKGYLFDSNVAVKGKIFNRAGVLYFKYDVSFALNTICDRCLDEIQKKFDFEFEHILVRELNESDNDEFIVTEDDKIFLDELVISDILLQLPSKILCNDECLGICPVCGVNLNYDECNCDA